MYDSIDDSAAIWDVTHYGELCEAKNRVAHFVATAQTVRSPRAAKMLCVASSDEEAAAAQVNHRLFRRGWKLLAGSVREVTKAEYEALSPSDDLEAFVETLAK